jgi:hypothetical protein
MSRNMIAALVAASALAGCITAEYGPIGARGSQFGYSDMRNADGSYTIRVVAMHAAQAHEYWDRRAGEICGSTTFRKNIFRADIPVITTSGYAVNAYNPAYGGSYTQDVYGALVMEGYLHCEAEAEAATAEAASAAAPAEAQPASASPAETPAPAATP